MKIHTECTTRQTTLLSVLVSDDSVETEERCDERVGARKVSFSLQVKFESKPSETVMNNCITTVHESSQEKQFDIYTTAGRDSSKTETEQLVQNQTSSSKNVGNSVKVCRSSSQYSNQSDSDTCHDVRDKEALIPKKDSLARCTEVSADVQVETLEKPSVEEEEDSESYPASSHYTENTDSVTGGFSLANRVTFAATQFGAPWPSVTRFVPKFSFFLRWHTRLL